MQQRRVCERRSRSFSRSIESRSGLAPEKEEQTVEASASVVVDDKEAWCPVCLEEFDANGEGALASVVVDDKEAWCPVCLEEFGANGEVSEMPCGHRYHVDGIIKWLEKRNTCPLCRFLLPMEENKSTDGVILIALDRASASVVVDDKEAWCPVCLEEFGANGKVSEMPCGHRYQVDCMMKWLENHNTCPLCRFLMPMEENKSTNGLISIALDIFFYLVLVGYLDLSTSAIPDAASLSNAFFKFLMSMEENKSTDGVILIAIDGASASVVVDDKEAWCSVSLEEFGANCEVSEMPRGHRYHVYCIMKWLEKHNNCPLCRFLMPMEENKSTNGVISIALDGASASVVVDDKEAWCPMCLEEFGANGDVSEMPCGHRYHVDCITNWLENHNTCPLCRFLMPMEENKSTDGVILIALDEASASVVVDDKEAWCPVCLEEFGANDEVSEMPCEHRYHIDCIMKWLEKHNTCPLCRFLMPMEENKPTDGVILIALLGASTSVVVDDKEAWCPVCLEEFGANGEVSEMPCGHRYHVDCIMKWLEKHNTCPLCRFLMPMEENKPIDGVILIALDGASASVVVDDKEAWCPVSLEEFGANGEVRALASVVVDYREAWCPMCLEVFGANGEVSEMPCGHRYHVDCIMKWLERHNTCPLRRFLIPMEENKPTDGVILIAFDEASASIVVDDKEAWCPVCLEQFGANGKVSDMPCGHRYHVDCIMKWLEKHNICPLCRFLMPMEENKPTIPALCVGF
ncbi:E3 ubiquitin-protein ligase [Nymphaea thermarum]|nr:E3 ubiquitin-protein ligase [Nymphaea thermarum]